MLLTIFIVAFNFVAAQGDQWTVEQLCPKELVDKVEPRYLAVYGDICFYFNTVNKKNYFDARTSCVEFYGTLAMPKTRNINTFLQNKIKDDLKYKKPMWIGLDKFGTKDIWEDFSPVEWSNFDKPLIDHVTVENCFALEPKNGKWHSYRCRNRSLLSWGNPNKAFICQYVPFLGVTSSGNDDDIIMENNNINNNYLIYVGDKDNRNNNIDDRIGQYYDEINGVGNTLGNVGDKGNMTDDFTQVENTNDISLQNNDSQYSGVDQDSKMPFHKGVTFNINHSEKDGNDILDIDSTANNNNDNLDVDSTAEEKNVLDADSTVEENNNDVLYADSTVEEHNNDVLDADSTVEENDNVVLDADSTEENNDVLDTDSTVDNNDVLDADSTVEENDNVVLDADSTVKENNNDVLDVDTVPQNEIKAAIKDDLAVGDDHISDLEVESPLEADSALDTTDEDDLKVDVCPEFNCPLDVDCGFYGYTVDERGCQTCECRKPY